MGRAWTRNEISRSMAEAAVEQVAHGDLDAAEKAFESTDGDFASKFRAAVEAAVSASLFVTERHVRIPENYEQLSKGELDALIRPFASSFLRSQPTRAELLDAVRDVDRRQRQHAQWAPSVDVDPLPPAPSLSYAEQRELGFEAARAMREAYEARRQAYYDEL